MKNKYRNIRYFENPKVLNFILVYTHHSVNILCMRGCKNYYSMIILSSGFIARALFIKSMKSSE